MKNRLLVDWLGFSIREDENAQSPTRVNLDIEYICRLLGIALDDFSPLEQRVKYYKACYVCNGISIKVPYEGKQGKQGYFITMTGKGCRYYEQVRKDSADTPRGIWQKLFMDLRAQTARGLAVNIPRLDIAVDDFTGALDMDNIYLSVLHGEVCSRFRRPKNMLRVGFAYREDVNLITCSSRDVIGQTVEFGSRESRAFCRFYDKLAEQRQRFASDAEKLEELSGIHNWTRMEFEFKKETAIVMVNALIDEPDFSAFFAAYVNGMIRFIDMDDSNISRCTVKRWWTDFLGTTARLCLSVGDYKPVTRARHLKYVHRSLYGAIYAAMNIEGIDEFLTSICEAAKRKLNRKHASLCGGLEYNVRNLCSADMWEALRWHPNPYANRFEETDIDGRTARQLAHSGFFNIDEYAGLRLA